MNNLIIDNHVISKDIKGILTKLLDYVAPGKLQNIQYKTDDVRISCPVHKDGRERKPSCEIYVGDSEKMTWGTTHCFACGFSGQLFDTIAEACDNTVSWAKWWLKEYFTEQILEGSNVAMDAPIILPKNMKEEEKSLDENILASFQSWHPYMGKRKLSKEICKKYEVKYDKDSECVVFPVRDINGKLKFLTRRSVNSKKFIIDKDIEKEVYLLYNQIMEHKREVYVVESQINALTLETWGYPAVALLGTGSDYQYVQLRKSGILKYNLCFDGDEAGMKGTKKFIRNMPNCFISVIEIPSGKDVNDLTKDEFNKLPIRNI